MTDINKSKDPGGLLLVGIVLAVLTAILIYSFVIRDNNGGVNIKTSDINARAPSVPEV